MTAPASDLAALLHGLVADPVRAQALMDGAWVVDAARWRDIVDAYIRTAPPGDRTVVAAVLAPTAPLRQVLHRYEIDCSVRLSVETARGGGIGVRPLDLGWEIIRGTTRSTASRVRVDVESVPAPVTSAAEAGAPAWTAPPLSPPEETVNEWRDGTNARPPNREVTRSLTPESPLLHNLEQEGDH
ncbi:MAG: hypothetical protein ABW020_05490 [Candidatus Rokuibacteriota bacterium]